MDTLRQHSARYVRTVLTTCGGNKRHACRMLEITYHTLNSYLAVKVSRKTLDERLAKRIERTRAKLTEAVNILNGSSEIDPRLDAKRHKRLQGPLSPVVPHVSQGL